MPSLRTSPDDRSQAVARVMRRIHDALVKAYALRSKNDQMDQAKLAEKLGVDKAVVSRRLSGSTNLTERTLAEMAWALGHEVVVHLVPREVSVKGNVHTEYVGQSQAIEQSLIAADRRETSQHALKTEGSAVTQGTQVHD